MVESFVQLKLQHIWTFFFKNCFYIRQLGCIMLLEGGLNGKGKSGSRHDSCLIELDGKSVYDNQSQII